MFEAVVRCDARACVYVTERTNIKMKPFDGRSYFCRQAVESIRAVVALCDSADEELRHVAIETLLTFGKKMDETSAAE